MSKTFDKLITHTCYEYCNAALKQGCYQEDGIRKVKNALTGISIFYKFTPQEQKKLIELGETETAESIKCVEVDYAVYAISLLNEYVTNKPKKQRLQFNMSDQKIKQLRANIIKDMIGLNKREHEKYEKVKAIVEDSKLTAKRFYNYFENKLDSSQNRKTKKGQLCITK